MSFFSASQSTIDEVNPRLKNREKLLSFGINYLDDAMVGIMPNDLILVGAGSGAGKTQLCCNIAAANIAKGKKVHYIALEAELYEIERRIKYQIFSKYFFQDPERPRIDLNFQNWMMGDFWDKTTLYEAQAADEMEKKYNNFFIYYKQEKFDVSDLTLKVLECVDQTDLILVDHVHYFDYDDEKENKAIKEIAKTARMLTLEQGKPMILVSHLRKRDKFSQELCPGLEEFHGSSDLYKIATKAITIGPGDNVGDGKYESFFRIVKNRFDGGVTRFIGRSVYNMKEGRYENGYQIGKLSECAGGDFKPMDDLAHPGWARNATRVCGPNHQEFARQQSPPKSPKRKKGF